VWAHRRVLRLEVPFGVTVAGVVRSTLLRGVVDLHGAAAVTGTLPDYVSPIVVWGDVARPTARVLTLLELLQPGGTRTSAELAERLSVDGRTVRRYVEHLRALGIPVDSVRGRYGGYRLARHYRMPPLMLTDEEALAVVWGLLLTGRSGSGPASIGDVEAATSKVRRVLPPALARQIDAVVETVNFTGGRIGEAERTGGGEEASARVLLGLAQAAGTGVRLPSTTCRGTDVHGYAPCIRTASLPCTGCSTSPATTSGARRSGRSAWTASPACACWRAPSRCRMT